MLELFFVFDQLTILLFVEQQLVPIITWNSLEARLLAVFVSQLTGSFKFGVQMSKVVIFSGVDDFWLGFDGGYVLQMV